MPDAGQLAFVHGPTRLQVENHRRCRVPVVVAIQALFGHGHVHARRAHGLQARDGAGQLALGRPAQVHPLGEFGGAEVAVIKQFEADTTPAGQALRGQQQAGVVDLRGGHRQRGPVRFTARGDAGGLEHGRRLGGILGRQVGERVLIGGAAAKHTDQHPRHQCQADEGAEEHARPRVHLREIPG